MLRLVLLAIFSIPLIHGQEAGQEDKARCINKMIGWCNSMQYSQKGESMSMISISYSDTTGHYRVFCISDSDGTNCSRNGLPWFMCTPDHTLTYKGQVLSNTSTNVDDDICNTTYDAFNRLFIQNMAHSDTGLSKEFFEEMDAFRKQMEELQKRISLFNKDLWHGFMDDNLSFPELDFKELDDSDQSSTEDSNQVERE